MIDFLAVGPKSGYIGVLRGYLLQKLFDISLIERGPFDPLTF